jgi:hypothetical protein
MPKKRPASTHTDLPLLAPGDQVMCYVSGRPFFCMVIGIELNHKVRIASQQWPSDQSAVVDQHDLAPINYIIP